ncbi:MAG: OsmC family protein [Candidatus Acidiferrales bacterium]
MQTATVKWIQNQQFLAILPSGHAIPFDNAPTPNTAAGSMEILLAALGTCTATDIIIILAKKRQELEGLELVISGERAPDPPQVWTKLEIIYRLRGKLDEKAVRDTIELSENKYCSVAAMLNKTAQITFRYEILPPEN